MHANSFMNNWLNAYTCYDTVAVIIITFTIIIVIIVYANYCVYIVHNSSAIASYM